VAIDTALEESLPTATHRLEVLNPIAFACPLLKGLLDAEIQFNPFELVAIDTLDSPLDPTAILILLVYSYIVLVFVLR
jgi:hypothetical protein